MAITPMWNYTLAGESFSPSLHKLQVASDFALKSQTPNEVVLTNKTSPIDAPETMRMSTSRVANIYNNTGIEKAYQTLSKEGASLLIQDNTVLRLVDETTSSSVADLPVSVHIVLKYPKHPEITEVQVTEAAKRLFSGLFYDADNNNRVKELIRGSLKPSGI